MQTVSLEFTSKRKAWEFPPQSRFVRHDQSDEEWARPLGYGQEVERLETLTIPNAVISQTDADGTIHFRAIELYEIDVSIDDRGGFSE